MAKKLVLNAHPIPDRAIVLDTETTGFTPKQGHRIVELAAIELIQGVPSGRSFHSYVNPQMAIPLEAQNVHGLSASFLSDKPLFGDIAESFMRFIGDPETPLWAHNAPFDRRFIEDEMTRSGHPIAHAFACSQRLAKALPHRGQDNKLVTLAKLIDYRWGARGAHSALEDTKALGAVLIKLLWPLEAKMANEPQAATSKPTRSPSKAKASTKPLFSLPAGFSPVSSTQDPRIRRFDEMSLEGKLFGRGKRWDAEEEAELASIFLDPETTSEPQDFMDALVRQHGRTPRALFLKLEGLGLITPDHPYARND